MTSNATGDVAELFASVGSLMSQYREALSLHDTRRLQALDRSAARVIEQLGLLRALQQSPEAMLDTAMAALAAKETNAAIAPLLSQLVDTTAMELRLLQGAGSSPAYDEQGRGHLHRLRASAGLGPR